jgi:hypothetical protein
MGVRAITSPVLESVMSRKVLLWDCFQTPSTQYPSVFTVDATCAMVVPLVD